MERYEISYVSDACAYHHVAHAYITGFRKYFLQNNRVGIGWGLRCFRQLRKLKMSNTKQN